MIAKNSSNIEEYSVTVHLNKSDFTERTTAAGNNKRTYSVMKSENLSTTKLTAAPEKNDNTQAQNASETKSPRKKYALRQRQKKR